MYKHQEVEKDVLKFWKANNIIGKLISKNRGRNYFLLDGPPYANFIPHVGHIKNTVFKDLIIRVGIMKGYSVLFQPGFDTHGLPVENMVEQKLSLKNKKDIERFGIDKFVKECKNSAILNKDLWMTAYKRLGSLYEMKEPYLTYENYYIDSAWWAFSKMHKKALVYEGEKPVMWCPHCETSLAGYEITDSYKDVTDPGIYVLFKLKDSEEYLLVYTTTPWTLPANIAIAIAPKEDYVVVAVNGKKIILAEKRLQKLTEIGFGYNIIKKFKGKELLSKKYEPLLNVPLQKELTGGKHGRAHEIVASIPLLKERVASKMRTKKGVKGEDIFEEFVTTTEGTGLVHTAPGHGKTDYVVGQHYKLACVSPLDDKCHFNEESGFSGFVKEADKDIIEKLESEGKLLFKEQITHSYPLCWRCKSPLIFRLSTQLFFKVDKVKKIIKKENKKVKWHPDSAKDRFENWVENAEDWNISRQRYWGIPIPIWKAEDGEEIVVKNRKELEKLSGTEINDLHNAENITIKKKDKEFRKVKGILDVWFDSGVAAWASLGYPYQNTKLFEANFPVSRINEAQDQIRGWFYSLMFCSTAVFNKPAYKEVSMTGWVVDKNGNKMSKSLGNVVTAEEALDELGADILRYYFCWDVAPYETQRFNKEIAKKEVGKILNVLWNLQNLAEKSSPKSGDIEDKWIFSRLESLTKKYTYSIDNFEYHDALREISDFILNNLSRGYVQITREKEKGEIISICLERLLKLLAPICPFLTEKIWQELRAKKIVDEESVHLSKWPKFNNKNINKNLEKNFEIVFEIIEKGLAEREKARIGLKWPLSKATINLQKEKKLSKELYEVIKRQLNLRDLEFKESSEIAVSLDTKITPELEAEGFSREFARNVQEARKKAGLQKIDTIELRIVTTRDLSEMLKRNIEFLKERINARKIEFVDDITEKTTEFEIKGRKVTIQFYNF